ncbi:MAG: SDR family oxidoreductase [Proteobacteria bacterium]|nr:SDR family oxidoreductase [Pseudomonadota bacterium]
MKKVKLSLKQEIVCITGATAGFGKATAEACAKEGAKLIVCGRRSERLTALTRVLSKHTDVHALTLDVRDKKAIHAALENLPKPFRNITALVNNAGLALGIKPAHQASLEQWEQMVDTNIKGLMYMTHAILPGMVKRGRGYILNIGSMAANYPYPGGNAYGGTKAFVKQFSLNLRADLLGTPVRVTCIEPGLAETEFSLVRLGDKKQAAEIYKGTEPLVAKDVAEAVLFCLTRPPHVNINTMEIMPVCQAFSPLAINRNVK